MAVKHVIWLLSRGDRMVNEDGAAGEAITPGMLVKGETTILKQTATTAVPVPARFALEREEMGKDIDTDYAIGDSVKVGTAHQGDRINALIASGQNITADGYLESAGNGTLKAFSAGTAIARALETSGAVTTLTRLRVEILVALFAFGAALMGHYLGLLQDGAPVLMAAAGVIPINGEAGFDHGKGFLRSGANGGRWATEQMVKHMKKTGKLSASALRTAEVLLKDEWAVLDRTVIEAGKMRLRAVADLIAAGLVINVPNGLAKTLFQWQNVSDVDEAIVSMSGVVRSENDRLEYGLEGLPLPITHKDFNIDLRLLLASREKGEGLDVSMARICGRKVGEKTEDMLFNGGKTYTGFPIYGMTNHPDVNLTSYGTGGAWAGTKTGQQILDDIQTCIGILQGKKFYGPYIAWVTSTSSLYLGNDFKANTTGSIRSRVLELPELSDIRTSDKVPAGKVIVAQMSEDVVAMVSGLDLQTVQWDLSGGFEIAFKALQILLPLVRSTQEGDSGIVVMS